MPVQSAEFVARLAIGEDMPDRVHSHLETQEQLDEFGALLVSHTAEFTKTNTADCMEDRRNILLAGTISDPNQLRLRIVKQLPGGLGLAVTKAGVAADAGFVRDARSMQDAYEKSVDVLISLKYEDGGHGKCGASTYVEESVAHPVRKEILLPTTGAVIGINEQKERAFHDVQQTKQRRLEDGFYGEWSSGWHEDFLSQRFPQNFMQIEIQDDPTHGHYADGVALFDDIGFAKNQFIEDTGKWALAVTRSMFMELAGKLGATEEERTRMLVAFADDLLNVSDKIIAPDMPVFALAA